MEEVEAVIALASQPDSQQRRILSYTVTGRWLRPQIEPAPQLPENQSITHELSTVGFSTVDQSYGMPSTTPTRKTRKVKKRKDTHCRRVSQQPDSTAGGDVVHESDPNEPRYCYCNNVSYGAVRSAPLMICVAKTYDMSQMVQCENPAKCPRDWVGS